jgi:hypothetical protein
VAFDQRIRALVDRKRISSDVRLGWGIGVGTFSPGSRKLRHALPSLMQFDRLFVRDAISLSNLKALGVAPHAVLGSDLVFMDSVWVPEELKKQHKTKKARARLGLILRD